MQTLPAHSRGSLGARSPKRSICAAGFTGGTVLARSRLCPLTKQHSGGCASVTGQTAVSVAEDLDSDVAIPFFPAPTAGAFLPDKRSFQEQHRIRGYEVSPDQRATMVTIGNLLQEVAGNHAVGMWGRTDEGFASLPSMKDVLFVMTRLQVRMFEYPKWGDIVNVETYFTEEGRLAFRRDWRITDGATGRTLGAATSTWVNINMATRRLTKVPDELRKRFLRLGTPSTTHVLAPEETKRKLPDMSLPDQIPGRQQVARRSDMDMNGHINNVTYLAWALESVPEDVYGNYQLYEVELDFKAECKAGDTLESHCSPLDGETGQPITAVAAATATANHNGSNGNGTNGTNGSSTDGAAAGGQAGPQVQFLTSLQKCEDGSCTELVRVRSTWRSQPGSQ